MVRPQPAAINCKTVMEDFPHLKPRFTFCHDTLAHTMGPCLSLAQGNDGEAVIVLTIVGGGGANDHAQLLNHLDKGILHLDGKYQDNHDKA